MAFALFAYQVGKPTDRTASYFQSRLTYYGCCLLSLGSLNSCLAPTSPPSLVLVLYLPAIGVAMYIVHFPGINIFVGLIQLLTGIFALLRRYGIMNNGKDDNRLQYCACFMWLCMLSMQILTQVGYAPEGMLAPAAPTIACLSLGISLMSAYLDYKMRNTPEILPADYYGSSDTAAVNSIQDDSSVLDGGEIAKETKTTNANASEPSATIVDENGEISGAFSAEYDV